VARAHVVVHGYRPGSLSGLGIDPGAWHAANPGLVEATLDAYGWSGPWAGRRGFDSIVQHSTGITAAGRDAAGGDRPVPLPCQALDHGAGWILAAAVAAGLLERQRTGHGSRWRTSLARVAELLTTLPRRGDLDGPAPTLDDVATWTEVTDTAWGPLRRLGWPGRIGDRAPSCGTFDPSPGVAPPAKLTGAPRPRPGGTP
jgi:crotonobetainyl-CoA:carnitine CoA-transferase CaiB-like acyl-CoA transferase